MQRYFIQLAYNGTNFHGWQIQPNAISVQEVLTKAISTVLQEKVEVVGAGRTDTGVHASFFVAHFELEHPLDNTFELCRKLNSFLNHDIKIHQVFEVDSEMHARFSATYRTYHYYLSNTKQPFRKEFTAYYPQPFDVELMNEAAQVLFDYTDFTSFSKLHTDVKTNNCKIYKAQWKEKNGLLVFEISADRFLRNMVRAVVGTLMEVGKHKITVDDVRQIIEKKDRCAAGASVLAKGLFLTDIGYPEPVNSRLIRTR
jgi:tRNA pseudouridine38-40 synthase